MQTEVKRTVVIEMTVQEYCELNNALINMIQRSAPSDIPDQVLKLKQLLTTVDV